MLVDSILYVSRKLVRRVSIILMSLPWPGFLTDFQVPDLLREKFAITVPFVFGEIAHLLHVRVAKLASARCNSVLRYFLPSIDKVLFRSHFILLSGSKKFSLLVEHSTSSRFALIIQSFSCSLCNQLNRFLRSKTATTLWVYVAGYCNCQGFASVWFGINGRLWTLCTVVAPCLWESYQCRILRRNICTRGKLQCDVQHERMCVVIVMRQIHHWNKPWSVSIHLNVNSVERDVGVGTDVGLITCVCLV